MSAEAAGVMYWWKPLAFLVGGLFAIIKGLLLYVWVRTTKDIKDNREDVSDLKDKIEKGYYTREHIDLIVQPLKDSVDRSNVIHGKLLEAANRQIELLQKIERADDRRN